MGKYWFKLYVNVILHHPVLSLAAIFLILIGAITQVGQFELDASADTLILENDAALKYYRSLRERYGADDFLIVTYSPQKSLFSPDTLDQIRHLRDHLKEIDQVESVVSLLDVPLVSSPRMTLFEIAKQIRTLETEGVDITLAQKELISSPFYKNLLVSSAGDTTALQVNLKKNRALEALINERENGLHSVQSSARVQRLNSQIRELSVQSNEKRDRTIQQVRKVMDSYRQQATLYLGGVPMIAADSIDYIRSDLKIFGTAVVIFMVVILAISFGSVYWVLLPLFTCLASALVMVGFLGWMQWPVTVVSSNFVSLLLIITLSLVIHLIVRYRELASTRPEITQLELVSAVIRSKFVPCAYTSITTMVAFGSLLISGIRPVIDFGWMMVVGIGVSFILAFTLFPAILVLLGRKNQSLRIGVTANLMNILVSFIHRWRNATLVLFIMLAAVGLTGLPQLSVENRFIDYFKEDTEIYQGMSLIDAKLGGTTPVEVIINAPASSIEDSFADARDITTSSYWFNHAGLLEVARIHDYLESLPETGKVLSIHSGMQLLQELNAGNPYSDLKLALLYRRLPENVKKSVIEPYLSPDGSQLRFSIRIYESDKSLQRQALFDKIENHLTTELGLDSEQVVISGMAVLYNNLLQSLFQSQILTVGAVFGVIFLMFIMLFQTLRLALVAIIPNIMAAGLILGVMGWIGIPLDIMTITIAAISIGIGVDNSIHYVHRFREEFARSDDYWEAIKRCHASIGHALYYTTVTVVLGFSILSLSSFIPTIYFGLLSGLAMMTALVANLMLLPVLIARFKLT